jgi:hypothetical protein
VRITNKNLRESKDASVLEMSKGSTPKKVLNMKIMERCPRGRKNKTKTGTTGYKICHTEGKKNTRSSGAGGLGTRRWTDLAARQPSKHGNVCRE